MHAAAEPTTGLFTTSQVRGQFHGILLRNCQVGAIWFICVEGCRCFSSLHFEQLPQHREPGDGQCGLHGNSPPCWCAWRLLRAWFLSAIVPLCSACGMTRLSLSAAPTRRCEGIFLFRSRTRAQGSLGARVGFASLPFRPPVPAGAKVYALAHTTVQPSAYRWLSGLSRPARARHAAS